MLDLVFFLTSTEQDCLGHDFRVIGAEHSALPCVDDFVALEGDAGHVSECAEQFAVVLVAERMCTVFYDFDSLAPTHVHDGVNVWHVSTHLGQYKLF